MNIYQDEYYNDIKLALIQLKRIANAIEKITNEKKINIKN